MRKPSTRTLRKGAKILNEELKVVISAEISELKKGVKDAQEEVNKFAKNGVSGLEQVSSAFSVMGEKSAALLKGVGVAVTGAATALLALSETTKEYRTAQEKLNTAFETAGASAGQASTTYNELYRVLGDGDVAVEAANHLAKITTNQADLAEWTNICQGVYATFGDSLPIEGLTEAANETIKVGEVTGSLADALNWAGLSQDKFQAKLDTLSTIEEREAFVRETLNGLYSEAAAGYEENAASILEANEAQAKLDATLATLGETMEPVMTALKELASDILADLTPHLQDFAEDALPKIKEELEKVGEKIGVVIEWLVDNWDTVSTVAAIVLAIAAAIVVLNAGLTAYNTVMGIAAVVSAPVTGIIVAITAAIAALSAGVVLLVKNWDTIKPKVLEVWEKVKDATSKAVTALTTFFKNLWENGIVKTFSKVGTWFTDNFTKAWNGVKNAFSGMKSFFSDIWASIKNTFSKVGEVVGNAITNTVKKAVNAVLSTAVSIINGFISAINLAISLINAIPGVNISKLSKLDVPKMAKGGIVDSATLALVGEQGKEAVIPLENNMEWLDKLANMLNNKLSGNNTPIVLNVDGKVFAETSISTINSLTRQSGKLGLVLA